MSFKYVDQKLVVVKVLVIKSNNMYNDFVIAIDHSGSHVDPIIINDQNLVWKNFWHIWIKKLAKCLLKRHFNAGNLKIEDMTCLQEYCIKPMDECQVL